MFMMNLKMYAGVFCEKNKPKQKKVFFPKKNMMKNKVSSLVKKNLKIMLKKKKREREAKV